jgi:hypothetical protein
MIHNTNKSGSFNKAWFCLKLALVFFWLPLVFQVLNNYSNISLPVSIWKWIPLTGQLPSIVKPILSALSVIIAGMWLFEKKMTLIAPTLAFLSILILSIEESNGIYNRFMTFSAVFAAIAVAYILQYYRPNNTLDNNRLQFPTQIIAATYVLSGLSKLKAAGFAWVTSGKYFALQVMKAHFSNYYSFGDENLLNIGHTKAALIQDNIALLTFLLSFSLIMELCAWVMIFFPKKVKYYGLLLLTMHIGIYMMMDIYILGIIIPMIIIVFNPLYWVLHKAKVLKIGFFNLVKGQNIEVD